MQHKEPLRDDGNVSQRQSGDPQPVQSDVIYGSRECDRPWRGSCDGGRGQARGTNRQDASGRVCLPWPRTERASPKCALTADLLTCLSVDCGIARTSRLPLHAACCLAFLGGHVAPDLQRRIVKPPSKILNNPIYAAAVHTPHVLSFHSIPLRNLLSSPAPTYNSHLHYQQRSRPTPHRLRVP